MNKTAIEAPLNQEFNLEEELEKVLNQESNLQGELDKVVTDAVQENADNASVTQSGNADSFEDLGSGSNKSSTDDENVAYLEHEKKLNKKGHVDSSDESCSDKSED